jgi:hypothetical protein
MLLLDDSGCSGLYDVVWRRVWCARTCAQDLTDCCLVSRFKHLVEIAPQ